jgi:small GTP-binding protein
MGINYIFNSYTNFSNENNKIENSNDLDTNVNNQDLLSNKEFYQNYIISLANLINKNVILLGDTKINKTRLFNILIGNKDNNIQEISTKHNYAYFEEKIININGLEININIWDTPGGESHKEANKHFIKDCIISYLCFHYKNRKSFENIKNYYKDLVKEINGKDAFIVLVGIKNKIIEDEDEDIIPINIIKTFAEKNNMLFYSVSLDDSNSVNYFFYDSIKQYSLYKAKLNFINK